MWTFAAIFSLFKVLFIYLYRSTDFEVHRNWLAITHSLPIREWYLENTSEWTLDYPPLFASFEYVMSQVAVFFDSEMLVVSNLNYASPATVLFQRLSVIFTDFVYIYAVNEFCNYRFGRNEVQRSSKQKLFILLLCNFGLLLVDHIHFQYNGFLFGIMLLSIVRICEGHCIEGAIWFAALLNFKHIYLYTAPAYFVFLLRNYCFQSDRDNKLQWSSFSVKRFIMLGFSVVTVFAVSLGPFVVLNQLPQVLSRLFPFKRGLCHAYWAPNVWTLYNVADKVLLTSGKKMGLLGSHNVSVASMTGGLVQEFHHSVLPSISPPVTFILTVLSILPCLLNMWCNPSKPNSFIRGITLCGFGSYMFGWHVHEKAILLVILPLTLFSFDDKRSARVFLLLSTVGHFSLFPLIFTPFETCIKYLLMLIYTALAFKYIGANVRTFERKNQPRHLPVLNSLETFYLIGLLPLEAFCSVLHPLLGFQQVYPFLPLMLTSFYCALGVFYTWLVLYKDTLINSREIDSSKEYLQKVD